MNITFTSEISHSQDKHDKIEFTAPVSIRNENNMRVFEFEEPQNKVMNWIEVGEDSVNIITGPTTISLSLNNELVVEYATPAGTIFFNSLMTELRSEENQVQFQYTLSQGKNTIGTYKITLSLS